MISIAVIGTGKIAQEILPVLDQMKEIEIKVLCGTRRSAETVHRLQEAYQIPYAFTDYGEFLEKLNAAPGKTKNTTSVSALHVDAIYLAVPNQLHHSMALQAIEAGQNVFLEKTFTPTLAKAEELISLSRQKPAMLIEAISNQYLPVLATIRSLLPNLGEIKYVECNFSQYSSRYDSFKAGEKIVSFDPECYGGALMDLQVYNLHLITSLFGPPEAVTYHANMEKGIDTSGVIRLEYSTFQAISIAANDSDGPCHLLIQGTGGYLQLEAKANSLEGPLTLYLHGQKSRAIDTVHKVPEQAATIASADSTALDHATFVPHRMVPEFQALEQMIRAQDWYTCIRQQEQTLTVCRILDQALKQIPYGEANKQLNDLRKAFWS